MMRAQVSSEFMIVYSALFTIFLVVFAIYYDGGLNLFQTQDKINSFRNANSVAAVINYVYLAGDGASYNFTVTNVLNEENITITDHAVTSYRPYASGSAPLINGNVNESTLDEKEVIVTNNQGEIDIIK